MSSQVLNLDKKDWEDDIKSSGLLLSKAIRAETTRGFSYPAVSDEEFNQIITYQVFFIRIGSRGLILDKRALNKKQYLVLQEEKES